MGGVWAGYGHHRRRWEYGGGCYAVTLSDLGIANHYDYRALGGGWIHRHTLHCERRE